MELNEQQQKRKLELAQKIRSISSFFGNDSNELASLVLLEHEPEPRFRLSARGPYKTIYDGSRTSWGICIDADCLNLTPAQVEELAHEILEQCEQKGRAQ